MINFKLIGTLDQNNIMHNITAIYILISNDYASNKLMDNIYYLKTLKYLCGLIWTIVKPMISYY